MTIPFQSDLKISLPQNTLERATIALSDTGDIQLVEGRDKLVEQIMRAVVNDQTAIRDLLNSTSSLDRTLLVLFTTILRDFKQIQIDDTKKSTSDFSGYKFYRKASGENETYTAVSPDPITWRFTDTGLTNGVVYDYGVTRIEKNIFESSFIDSFSISPTRFTGKYEVMIGDKVSAISGNEQITFYVDYNRRFKASELLDKIESITIDQDENEPRRYSVNVIVKDLLNNNVSLAVQSISAITGR